MLLKKESQPAVYPYPYQEEAISAVLNTFETEDRTNLVMACGSGKTLVSLWVAERIKAKRIVVFVPSLALIAQLLKEWLKATSWDNVSYLALCSDESVVHSLDSIVLNPEECDFPVTTNAEEVALFLKEKKGRGVKIVFCTYHSGSVLAEAIKGQSPLDLGIFDEAHKTTGNNYFGLALLDKNVPIKKRLFMTATPRHYDVNQKNKDGESKLVFSMNDGSLYGTRAYTLSFRKAIELGIIVDYKIIVSVVESKNHLSEQTELEEKVVGLQKAIEELPNISKIITFHSTIENAYHFREHIKANHAFSKYPCFHVSGILPTHTRTKIMQDFYQTKRSIITNARCLSEGIDAPAVDMVAFLNKKSSKIDIVQSIGRAMRKSPGKTCGHIFLPLFIEKNSGEDLESAVERANFKEIWEVVQALSEHDDSLQDKIKYLRQEKGKTGSMSVGFEKYLGFVFNSKVNVAIQKILSDKISVMVVNKVVSGWYEKYGQLQKYKEKHGDCEIPQRYSENPSLALWVNTQRQAYKKQQLSPDKIKLLEDIGFNWVPLKSQWHKRYNELIQYKLTHGDCEIPAGYTENPPLASWVNTQRQTYKKNQLSPDKIKLLKDIGFEWESYKYQWNKVYNELLQYKSTHGDCEVPKGYSENPSLALWVKTQRKAYKKQQLSPDKIKLLEDIGFDWVPLKSQWHKAYDELVQYKLAHGNCLVPYGYTENPTLASWVNTQRQAYKNNQLSQEKIKLLIDVGFKWAAYKNQ